MKEKNTTRGLVSLTSVKLHEIQNKEDKESVIRTEHVIPITTDILTTWIESNGKNYNKTNSCQKRILCQISIYYN